MRARNVSDNAGGARRNMNGTRRHAARVEQMGGEAIITTMRYKDLLAHLAGAVAVGTTRDAAGQVWGFTASSFCSLSLDPPLVLFCLAHSADCHAAFTAADSFAISILTAQQAEVSQRFAVKGNAKYTGVRFVEGELDMPLIPGALAWLECRAYATYPGGDHTIVVGQVAHGGMGEKGASNDGARPLLYYDRTYGTFTKDGGGP
jgi:flavin reductase ActVB